MKFTYESKYNNDKGQNQDPDQVIAIFMIMLGVVRKIEKYYYISWKKKATEKKAYKRRTSSKRENVPVVQAPYKLTPQPNGRRDLDKLKKINIRTSSVQDSRHIYGHTR